MPYKVSLLRNPDVNYLDTYYNELSDAIRDCIDFEPIANVCVSDENGNILYPADKVNCIGFSLEAFPIKLGFSR